ncbi:hypothetical protein T03_8690 [Trichinella britovi]|uniref:Uncharacterized protein n=1 Tax=Trichinella britovi TaxID=45882 RepID=A0A0V1CX04_TRIBR|nr:hypothetical protein T03_8690 [Trichinella britovi]
MLIKSASNTLIGHFVLPYRRRLFEQFYSGLSLLGRHISLLDKRAMLKWLELYKRKPIFCYFIPNRSHENQHSDYNCLLTSAQMNRKWEF